MDEQAEYTNTSLFFDAVTRLAGDAGVAAIIAARGGTEVFIPNSIQPDHWLAAILGYKVALSICYDLRILDADNRAVGNFAVNIPQRDLNLHNRTNSGRRDAIRQALLAGEAPNAIALRLRTNARTVWRHRAKLHAAGKLPRKPPRQRP